MLNNKSFSTSKKYRRKWIITFFIISALPFLATFVATFLLATYSGNQQATEAINDKATLMKSSLTDDMIRMDFYSIISKSQKLKKEMGLETFYIFDSARNVIYASPNDSENIEKMIKNINNNCDIYTERDLIVKCSKIVYGNNKHLGHIVFSSNTTFFFRHQNTLFFTFLLTTLLVIVIIMFVVSRMITSMYSPIFEIFNDMPKILTSGYTNFSKYLGRSDEIRDMNKTYNSVVTKMLSIQKEINEKERLATVGEIAGQVAHDIRSPLAALDMVLKDFENIPESKRMLIRSAVTRIHDIANGLLQKNRALVQNVTFDDQNKLQTVLLPVLIEEVITEKRMQFRSKANINIDLNIVDTSYGLFAKIQPGEMKRIASNLLNNSVEALGDAGNIEISFFSKDERSVEIRIKDNGPGIAPEALSKLGNRGETYGKNGGNGLGLYHAIKSINSWDGTLKIESKVGVGTTIIINLPKAKPPKTFCPVIKISPNSTLVVVDDDESIHQVWNERLDSIDIEAHNIEVIHFSCPKDAEKWINKKSDVNTFFLVDYEYLGHRENGLDFIEKMSINRNACLVTSRFEEKEVQVRCEKLGLYLLPKCMASSVPLSIDHSFQRSGPDKSVTTILIDDDDLIRIVWESSASKKNIPFKAYSHPEEIFSNLSNISKESNFYIDSDLKNNIKGEDIAKQLFDLGFKNLHFATGHEAEQFQHLYFLKSIGAKNPPWESSEI